MVDAATKASQLSPCAVCDEGDADQDEDSMGVIPNATQEKTTDAIRHDDNDEMDSESMETDG